MTVSRAVSHSFWMTASQGRLASLDILRAIAVVLVIFRHAVGDGPIFGWPDWAKPILHALGRGGWVGVDLFFVLSGFLVSGLLFREYQRTGDVSVKRFLLRRGLKIYPAFYVLLAFELWRGLDRGVRWEWIDWRYFISEALFVQNYWLTFFGHTWSLAVEEHFYLLCALTIAILTVRGRGKRDPYGALLPLFAVAVAGCLAARFATDALAPRYSHNSHLFPTHLRLDALMFGVTLSYIHHFRPGMLERLVVGRRLLVGAIGMCFLAPAFLFNLEESFVHTAGLTLFYLGSGLLLLSMIMGPVVENAFTASVSYVGRHSYSIYLWHILAIEWVAGALEPLRQTDPLPILAVVAGCWAVGIVTAKLIEFPVLKLRDRFFPDAPAPAPVPPPESPAIVMAP
jgi:peptidoglycan/LPS O-acetylase OafA/YrhL